jgi:hypothetical protein
MDQDQRIQKLKEQAMELSGGQMQSFGLDQMPRDMAEEFLKRLIAFETAPDTTDFETLTADGVPLPSPEEVSDRDIGTVLWRVIFGLAKHRVFLEWTNHLSDRELYSALWNIVLRQERPAIPEGHTGSYHVCVPGDDPHYTNYLSYYANDDTRKKFGEDDPTFVPPPRKYPRYDRDEDLPRADDDPQCAEARAWLQASTNPSALATNRFGRTSEALKFVEQLYAAGASCVIVDHIETLPHDNGERYADELIVVFPHDARRNDLYDLIENAGLPDTVDDQEHVIDQGRGSAKLWWD